MARKVDVVRPRELRDVIEFPRKRQRSNGSAVALGIAMLLTAIAVGFALGLVVARLWGSR